MMRKSPMKPGAGLKRTAFARGERIEAREVSKLQRAAPAKKAKLKTKELAVTAKERAMWGRLAALGCVACMKDGNFNSHVSIHHVHGRTAPDCHKKVLPLCGPHHQDDGTALAVHPWKARWEARYGKQDDLIVEIYKMIGMEYAP